MATTQKCVSLLSRFRGCICGAMFGDCLGAEAEMFWSAKPIEKIVDYMNKMKSGEYECVLYTDDTCMTLDLGESLVRNKKFDPLDVSKSFSLTYFASDAQRFYGGNVVSVFHKLSEMGYKDPWGPAKEQFNGTGSYGNGSAMRVAPIPLFYHGDRKEIVKYAGDQSRITHTHPQGVNGAVIQALVIDKVMGGEKISDPLKFCSEILEELKESSDGEIGVYEEKFHAISRLLGQEQEVQAHDIEKAIGTGVTAHQAVPAALFCFLYTLDKKNVKKLENFDGFTRAVVFSVAVSFDCDTVGSMVGAIAGPYYGYEEISEGLLKSCEGSERVLKLADDLFQLNQSKS